MKVYSNNRTGERTLDRMRITIKVPGDEKFGVIARFEKPTRYNVPYPYDHEFCEGHIQFEDLSEIEMMIGALQKLQELMEKYEIDENDLSDDKKEKYQFKYKNEFEKKLIKQIAYRTFKKEWSERMYTYSRGRGKRSIMLIECTKAEEIQLRIEYEFYKDLWKEEAEFLFNVFIQKHRIFDPEGSCKKDHYRMKEQDLKRMSMMEMLLQDKTMTKMLEARE